MKLKAFRFCMIVGAAALACLAIFYFAEFVEISIAINNNGMQPDLKAYIRALWLSFACQSLLIGGLYALVAWKPHAVSREVIVILGMLQLLEAVLQLSFSGSNISATVLTSTAAFVLLGAALWPKRLPDEAPRSAGS